MYYIRELSIINLSFQIGDIRKLNNNATKNKETEENGIQKKKGLVASGITSTVPVCLFELRSIVVITLSMRIHYIVEVQTCFLFEERFSLVMPCLFLRSEELPNNSSSRISSSCLFNATASWYAISILLLLI